MGLFVICWTPIFWHEIRVRGLNSHTVQESLLSRPYDFANMDSFGTQVASVGKFGLQSRH